MRLGTIVSLVIPLGMVACGEGSLRQHGHGLRVDLPSRAVAFSGRVYPSRFNAWYTTPKNHHFIVWKDGRAARNALIRSDVSDEAVLTALLDLGARVGDNLSADAWERRYDAESSAPDGHVGGTLVDVSFSWGDDDAHTVGDVLEDHGRRGFRFRVGGHRSLITRWRSGCIVCLESCPGGRISNERYTLRDLAEGVASFAVRADELPNDGTLVRVTIRIVE